MTYTLRSGNPAWVKSVIKTQGSQVPIMVDARVDEMEWAVYADDECYEGPYPLNDKSVATGRARLRELGVVWGASSKVIPLVQPAVAAETVKPKLAPVELTLDVVTSKITRCQGKTIETFIEIGRWLIEAKRLVSHGHWLEYLETQVDMSANYAAAYMRLYQKCGPNPQTFVNLTLSKVLLILEAPEEARDEIIELARTSTTVVVRLAVREANRRAEMRLLEPKDMGEIIAVTTPAPIPEATPGDPPPPPLPAPPVVAPETVPEATPLIVTQPTPPEPVPPAPEPSPAAPAPEIPQSTPKAQEVVPEPQPPARLISAEAARLNKAFAAIREVVSRHKPLIEPFDGRTIHGDDIDLEKLYATEETLLAMVAHLKRIASECTR